MYELIEVGLRDVKGLFKLSNKICLLLLLRGVIPMDR